ncbi:MAG: ribonuclease III [Lachnospiraceae bacterium]|nr:ribonuclease III [Lachnospiraceae bacterium]
MNTDLKTLEDKIGYRFQNRDLLLMAVTHTSYANEHKRAHAEHNERLEYLGDAILDLAAAEYLYIKYPEKPEGELSKLRASMVSEQPLAKSARAIGLPDYLRLGKGEEQMGGRSKDSIVSDATEAVIGAIYLDGGFEKARTFAMDHILLDLGTEDLFTDIRSPLQEYYQQLGKKVEYRVTGESGPDHDKRFEVSVFLEEEVLGTGSGRTKKGAAQAAAQAVMEKLGLYHRSTN